MSEAVSIQELTVDLDELTIDEIETVEEITGLPIDKLGEPDTPKGKFLRALAYVAMRRTNPDLTLEEVGAMRIKVGQTAGPLEQNGHSPG